MIARPHRAAGILLHPTSLPGRYGIGDLGQAAVDLLRFLERAGCSTWQLLPIGPPGYGGSPYLCTSDRAGNPALISPGLLARGGFLTDRECRAAETSTAALDPDRAAGDKRRLVGLAWERFRRQGAALRQLADYRDCHRSWLDDYALFAAIKHSRGGEAWWTWPRDLRRRRPRALEAARNRLADLIAFETFQQFLFDRQWQRLREACGDASVELIGDIPFYVAHDSVDVWTHPELFSLDPDSGRPRWVAGVPPDYFSDTGQLWGCPVYEWATHEAQDFAWWIERIRRQLDRVDILRIDHFRGFEAFWRVPGGAATAIEGEWVQAPGRRLFAALSRVVPGARIIAEDLGMITPAVDRLRRDLGFPGMRVLQFGFEGDGASPHLPHNVEVDTVVYPGTHDNDTAVGWYGAARPEVRARLLAYAGTDADDRPHWALVRLALTSVARWAVVTAQDLIGLGSEARMNTPGRAAGNWTWRLAPGALDEELADRLGELVSVTGRGRPPARPRPSAVE